MHSEPAPIDLPRQKGSYVLLLELACAQTLTVGRLGALGFGAGFYAYTGSARGPGGLAARLGHHLGRARRCHWHIDYLRRKAPVVAVWACWGETATVARFNECRLADRLSNRLPLQKPFKGFGSSDCACLTHLLYWPLPLDGEPCAPICSEDLLARFAAALAPLRRVC